MSSQADLPVDESRAMANYGNISLIIPDFFKELKDIKLLVKQQLKKQYTGDGVKSAIDF